MYLFTAREDNGYFVREAKKIGFKYLNQLVMVKVNPPPHFNKNNWRSKFEICMYLSKGKPSTFNFLSQQYCTNIYNHVITNNKQTKHPTEKPLEFINKLIKVSSNKGDLVLDPFMGSGTVAVSCKSLKRDFIGFEKEEGYIQMINERLSKELPSGDLNKWL